MRSFARVLSQVTGLTHLPAYKTLFFAVVAGVLIFSQVANIAPEAEALGTIDDADYPSYIISHDSFIYETSHGTGDPKQIEKHTVAEDETLANIASQYNISVTTLKSVNKLTSALIQPGQVLDVPNIDVLLYTVKKKDTVESIAKAYSASGELVGWYNSLDEENTIHEGDVLYIPGGIDPSEQRVRSVQESGRSSGRYVAPGPNAPGLGGGSIIHWPMPAFTWIRGFTSYHTGLDLANPTGTPVYAGCDGTIAKVSVGTYGGGYGTHLIDDCDDGGLMTLYGHLSAVEVELGQAVTVGQEIGRVGSTGRSTGPHLHYEVFRNGTKVDPLLYLKGNDE